MSKKSQAAQIPLKTFLVEIETYNNFQPLAQIIPCRESREIQATSFQFGSFGCIFTINDKPAGFYSKVLSIRTKQ